MDVTAPQAELNETAKEAWAIYGRIDVLVNNAGYIQGGTIEEIGYVPASLSDFPLNPTKHFTARKY